MFSPQSTHSISTKEVNNMANNNSNQLVVPGVQQALDQMKYEIAQNLVFNLVLTQLLVLTDLLVEKSRKD